jgi:uncharacterized membrane protein (UPF0127 family)
MSSLINQSNNITLEIEVADSFLKRFLGLMGRKSIEKNEGLLFILDKPTKLDATIHMFFMRFDIAVIWLSEDQKVVDTAYAKRWHPSYMPKEKAKFFIEAHPSQLANFTIGDQVKLS